MSPIANTLLQRLADPALLLILAGMTAYGFHYGVFLATLAALQVLGGSLLAVGCIDEMTEIAMLAGCPEPWCGAAGYAVTFLGVIVLTRLAIGAAVPEWAVRFTPTVDAAAGAVVGLLAGVLLCGGILVAWTMAPVPASLRIEPAELRLDMGPKILGSLARLAASDATLRRLFFSGEPSATYHPPEPPEPSGDSGAPPPEPPPPPPLVGEPFADDNGNGRHDPEEPFLDIDHDGSYTDSMTFDDLNRNDRRDVGLLERYRIGKGRWDRVIVVPPPAPVAEPAEEPAGVSGE